MLQISIERFRAQVGTYPARIVKERERLAILARTAFADREHMGDEPEAVSLECAE